MKHIFLQQSQFLNSVFPFHCVSPTWYYCENDTLNDCLNFCRENVPWILWLQTSFTCISLSFIECLLLNFVIIPFNYVRISTNFPVELDWPNGFGWKIFLIQFSLKVDTFPPCHFSLVWKLHPQSKCLMVYDIFMAFE